MTVEPGPALVTGASRGIGRAVALGLARRGHPVAVNFRSRQAEADEVVEAITDAGGVGVALQADVADASQASALVQTAESRLGPLQILVNNAGITRDRLLVHMSEADWAATWDTDLAGPRAAARAAIHSMAAHGEGRIVNLSSVVGATGNAGQANYAAAKSAILGLTQALAVVGARHGVTVNCVVPGYIPTDATAHLTPDQVETWFRRIPMGRGGTTADIADVILFLCGPTAGYITGQCIAVDGGLLAASAVPGV